MEAEQKGKKTRGFFGTQPKKNPARAGWPKRFGLVRATADFAGIPDLLLPTITAFFPFKALLKKIAGHF